MSQNNFNFNVLSELMKLFPILETDINKQIDVISMLDILSSRYEINAIKEDQLIESDIVEKISYYLMAKHMKGLSPRTIKEYASLLQKFAIANPKLVTNITTGDIRIFLNCNCRGNSADTKNNKIILINDFFEWIKDEGYINNNPAKRIEKVKAPKRIRRGLTPLEQEKLRKACKSPRTRAMVELFLSSGVRLSELTSIKIQDIDWENNNISIIGKGDKERVVKFDSRSKLYMQDYIHSRRLKSDYLFCPSRKKNRYDSDDKKIGRLSNRVVQREISLISKELKIHIFPHKLRHSFASSLNDRNVNIMTIKDFMGHNSVSTTQTYISNSKEKINFEYAKAMQ